MTRRAKLSRAERERRAAKRERRAATAGERETRRAVRAALRPEPARVVCDGCGLEQPYDHAEWILEDYVAAGEVEVARCPGFEGIGCGSETAITVERVREETAEPLVYIYGP